MKLALVTSGGGHFFQLYQLKPFWKQYPRFWVTFDKEDVNTTIPKEKKYCAYYPESRNIKNSILNCALAFKILLSERPTVVFSAGAAIAVSFLLAAKCLRIKTIYMEPVDFIKEPSLSGKMIYTLRLADLFLVQSHKQLGLYPKATYWGSTI